MLISRKNSDASGPVAVLEKDTSGREGGRFTSEQPGTARLSPSEVASLVESLRSENGTTRRVVYGALRRIGAAAIPALCRAMYDPSVAMRQDAINLLREMGQGK